MGALPSYLADVAACNEKTLRRATCCTSQEGNEQPAVIFTQESSFGHEAEGGDSEYADSRQGSKETTARTRQDPQQSNYAEACVEECVDNKSTTMACEFIVDGEGTHRVVLFNRKPLGMMFANMLPLTVTKVAPGKEAAIMGVRPGWVFSKVAGKSLENMDLDHTKTLIKKKTKHLPLADTSDEPSGGFLFEFDAGGTSTAVVLYKQPLGMVFDNKLPLSVTKIIPGSEAAKHGVEPGWVFKKVGDVPVEGMDLEKLLSMIMLQSMNLPVDKCIQQSGG